MLLSLKEKIREMMGLAMGDHFKKMVDDVINDSLAIMAEPRSHQPNPEQLLPHQPNPEKLNSEQPIHEPDPEQLISEEPNPSQNNMGQPNTKQYNLKQVNLEKSYPRFAIPKQANPEKAISQSVNLPSIDLNGSRLIEDHFNTISTQNDKMTTQNDKMTTQKYEKPPKNEKIEVKVDSKCVNVTQTDEKVAKQVNFSPNQENGLQQSEIPTALLINGKEIQNGKNEGKENGIGHESKEILQNHESKKKLNPSKMENGSKSNGINGSPQPKNEYKNGRKEHDGSKFGDKKVEVKIKVFENGSSNLPKCKAQNGKTPTFQKYVSPIAVAKSKFLKASKSFFSYLSIWKLDR